jgi:hypothetical protein
MDKEEKEKRRLEKLRLEAEKMAKLKKKEDAKR